MLNRADFVGRITTNPQIQSVGSNNTDVCNFTIAVDRDFKNKKTGQYDADFIRCTAWGVQADFLKDYIQRGGLISVDGQVRTRRAPDRNNPGHYRYFTGVHVDEVSPCESLRSRNQSNNNNNNNQNTVNSQSNNSTTSETASNSNSSVESSASSSSDNSESNSDSDNSASQSSQSSSNDESSESSDSDSGSDSDSDSNSANSDSSSDDNSDTNDSDLGNKKVNIKDDDLPF